jgi:UDP-N-acetyl-alpha-D-muramoyl-L-alanyl-L-glutamate epimerase
VQCKASGTESPELAGNLHRVREQWFDPAGYDTFTYTGVGVDLDALTIEGRYRLSGEAGELGFAETFRLAPDTALVGPRRSCLERIARLLWFAAGLSYYKTAAPRTVVVPALSEPEREWLEALYREGLGEFAVVNGVDLSTRPVFQVAAGDVPAPVAGLGLERRSLVAVGGGKDSCVSLEVLRAAGGEVLPFSVGGHRAAKDCAAAAGLPLVVARRVLDPQLGELNRAGALNGHVPVTAIVSLVALAQAVVLGADEVVFSNERSADAPSFWAHGLPVNHQYSKGLAAERRLRAALSGATPEIAYYSLLRPLSELRIASVFARLEPYLPVFTSCNAAFRLEEGRRVERWCGHCPKCRFVFLVLAPFLPRPRLVPIFGADLLDDEAQLDGYRELLGLTGFKPFECVGEIEESQAALVLAARDGDWAGATLVGRLLGELRAAGAGPGDAEIAAILAPGAEHELPSRAQAALGAALAAAEPAGAR